MSIRGTWKWSDTGKVLLLAAVYFVAAKWGLLLAIVQSNATAIWPPTGIALAALLMGGLRLWPGVFLGAFLANLFTAGTVWTSLGIAAGNSAEALLGAFLIIRFAAGRWALERTAGLFKFTFFGGMVAPLASATVGVSTLGLAGMLSNVSFGNVWVTWWLGDMGGALLFAPPILLAGQWPDSKLRPWRLAEWTTLVLLLGFLGWLLFGGGTGLSANHTNAEFLLFPLLLWAGVRFGPFFSSLAVLALSLLAIRGTFLGWGPFHEAVLNQSLLLLQYFMSVTSVTILALATDVAERRKAEEDLRWSQADLQLKVLQRTENLTQSNAELEREVAEKEELARGLWESNRKFYILSEATQEGVVMIQDGCITVANSNFNHMFGCEGAQALGKSPADFVVPEHREMVARYVREGHDQLYSARGLRRDGTTLDLEIHGKTVKSNGKDIRISTLRDVTERNRRDEERRRLALLVEASSDFICLVAMDGRMIYLNGEGRQMVGLEPNEDIRGLLHQDFIEPRDVPRLLNDVIPVIAAKGHWEGEFDLRHFTTGESLPLHFTAALVPDPVTGEPQAMAGIGRDLREMRKKDEELRRTALFVENVQDYAIFFLDPRGTIVSWNEGAQRIKGYDAAEVIGRDFSMFYTPEDIRAGKPAACLEQAARAGRMEEEGWRVRKDGSRFWAETILTALRDDKGTLTGYAKISRDVTQRKRIEELARSNQELEQFAYVASHDLQEPLRMVASYVQLLGRKYGGKLDSEADTYIHQAVDGAKRMQALINDLLAYSRVGNQPRAFDAVDFEAILDEALRNLGPTIQEKGAQVTHDHLPTVVGDPHQFLQLLQNLIGNAMKFHGKEPSRIHVGAVEKEGEWHFSVRDNGIGVEPQFTEKIFEIFKRLHTRAEYPGTGMGLAICRKVVNRHGGRIWMESKPGEGSTVHWTLPAQKGAPLGKRTS